MMKCLILAGGFGTRLYPLTINTAKALLEYKGKPLLTHLIDRIPQDIDVLISINRKFEADFQQWREVIDRPVQFCVENAWSDEQRKGAVGSLNYWVKHQNITEDLLVIAGDNYFEMDLSRFTIAYNGDRVLVAVYDIGDRNKASHFGVVRLDGDKIVELEEKPNRPKSSLVATACYILPPRIFPHLAQYCSQHKRDNLGSFISHLAAIEDVHSYVFYNLWLDIGTGRRAR